MQVSAGASLTAQTVLQAASADCTGSKACMCIPTHSVGLRDMF